MSIKSAFAILAALIGWVSLLLQLILFIDNRTVSAAMALVRFFTFFTILTNLLAASMFTAIALRGARPPSGLATPAAITAIAAYITVVGIIYNTVLRGIVELQGLNAILNESLHVVLPIAALLFWLIFVPKQGLQWRAAFTWLLYPFVYIIWVIVFGAMTGFYPYPFTDVTILGYPRAIINGLVILAGFLVIFFIMIAAGRIRTRSV
jgi:hypothetical protein